MVITWPVIRALALVLAAVLSFASPVCGFCRVKYPDQRGLSSGWSMRPNKKVGQPGRVPLLPNRIPFSWTHSVFVYGTDEDSISNMEDVSPSSSSSPPLVEALTAELDPSILTRVACAFAPPHYGENLHPNDVESTILVEATPDRLEIALAVPSSKGVGGSCDTMVQLLVPIDLPSNGKEIPIDLPSNGKEEEGPHEDPIETIVQQMKELDRQAQDILLQNEQRQDQYEIAAAEIRLKADLEEEPYADQLPDWWTFPELRITLADECTSLKKLLNENDFAADRRALCQCYFENQETDHGPRPDPTKGFLRASVASVGPSGLFLRALTDDESAEPLGIQIPFPQGPANTSEDLRSSVLKLIESIELPTTPLVDQESTDSLAAPLPSLAESSPEDMEESETQLPHTIQEAESLVEAARKQPKSQEEEARLAAKYAAIEDLGDRAFAILQDLYMI